MPVTSIFLLTNDFQAWTAFLVEVIWPNSQLPSPGVLPLRTFIQEALRRSRTSYTTLQLTMYYLLLLNPHAQTDTSEMADDTYALKDGRRMFLASLVLTSKYLQDRKISSREWGKIAGLPTTDINRNEMVFLTAINWNLHLTNNLYERWSALILQLFLMKGTILKLSKRLLNGSFSDSSRISAIKGI